MTEFLKMKTLLLCLWPFSFRCFTTTLKIFCIGSLIYSGMSLWIFFKIYNLQLPDLLSPVYAIISTSGHIKLEGSIHVWVFCSPVHTQNGVKIITRRGNHDNGNEQEGLRLAAGGLGWECTPAQLQIHHPHPGKPRLQSESRVLLQQLLVPKTWLYTADTRSAASRVVFNSLFLAYVLQATAVSDLLGGCSVVFLLSPVVFRWTEVSPDLRGRESGLVCWRRKTKWAGRFWSLKGERLISEETGSRVHDGSSTGRCRS